MTRTDSRQLFVISLLALLFVVLILSILPTVELPKNTPVVSYTSDISCRYPDGAQVEMDIPLVNYTSDITCAQ